MYILPLAWRETERREEEREGGRGLGERGWRRDRDDLSHDAVVGSLGTVIRQSQTAASQQSITELFAVGDLPATDLDLLYYTQLFKMSCHKSLINKFDIKNIQTIQTSK